MLDKQQLLLVDENDKFSGKYADKQSCHFGKGKHHRAFVVVIFNKKGEVLLQKRKHKLWDSYLDVSAISHVHHLADHDETYEEAALRSLKKEVGITKVKLEKVAAFNYYAEESGYCENEYCAILTGEYNGKVIPNKNVVYNIKWVDKKAFIKDIKKNSNKYTPWAILTAFNL